MRFGQRIASSRSGSLAWLSLCCCCCLVVLQFQKFYVSERILYHAHSEFGRENPITVVGQRSSSLSALHSRNNNNNNDSLPKFPSLPVLPKEETFGACLMVKGDNDLLSEWVPYHYTLLPLRYLLVVTDAENSEDPAEVLEKWTASGTGLRWWVVNVTVFENLYGAFDGEGEARGFCRKEKAGGNVGVVGVGDGDPDCTGVDQKSILQHVAHKHLVHKQKAMITHCTKLMKENGVHYVSMYDTDEFITINKKVVAEQQQQQQIQQQQQQNSSNTTMVKKNTTGDGAESLETHATRPNSTRRESSDNNKNNITTVIDIIHSLKRTKHFVKPCHTIPRVSVGTNESFTCPGSEKIKAFARENFDHRFMSTLRYQKHADPKDWKKNRFGKVFLDLSRIPDRSVFSVTTPPRNIHRPFADECPRAVVAFDEAPFYLMHYAGGWERFRSKNDKRRDYGNWKELAGVGDSTSRCRDEIYRWLPRFVDQVGLDRATALLTTTTDPKRTTAAVTDGDNNRTGSTVAVQQ